MSVRKKSKFEQWFSLSRHKRRVGAKSAMQLFAGQSLDELKTAYIDGDTISYTFGSKNDLNAHLGDLQHEFVGKPRLCYYHACLIVLLRRDIDTTNNYRALAELWATEQDFLLKHLNTRWLIAACDSFIDHHDDPVVQALLLNAVVLINTLKLSETEHYFCQVDFGAHNRPDSARMTSLQQSRLALFDGTSAFAVGTDDTLRNMRWRLDKVCQLHPLGQIVLQIFDRLQNDTGETVYSRLKQQHTRTRTRWW